MTGENFHIISGGPGAGKTTLIAALRARQFLCMDEAARAILREQRVIGGNAVHTGDRAHYLELMLSRSIADYERVTGADGPVFFDRGLPELVGYCAIAGLSVPDHVRNAATRFRYGRRVFLAPPWPAIYENDSERVQTLKEAQAGFDAAVEVYGSLGYETVELPRAPVAERVDFILEALGLAAGSARIAR
jgi:predicted ATPase